MIDRENKPLAQSALLQQLQQRLIRLGQTAKSTAADKKALADLITLLLASQQQGNGTVLITEVELVLAMSLSDLQQAFPAVIGTENAQTTPIVCFPPFVAFRRRFQEIDEIVRYLHAHTSYFQPPSDKALSAISWQLPNGFSLTDEQRLAAFSAASLSFTLITGGAGTGKTTTLTKALELILLDKPEAKIALAAPTGKAAHRLNESLMAQLPSVGEVVRGQLAELQAMTLHRLLGVSEKTGKAYHHAGNPIDADVLAIDESSMVGGSLFGLLQSALLPQTTLILLGDANQLPAIDSLPFFNEVSRLSVGYSSEFRQAVEALEINVSGANLSEYSSPLPNHLCHLTAAKRFAEASPIELAAKAILAQDSEQLFAVADASIVVLSSIGHLSQRLGEQYPTEPKALLADLSQRMILCATRQGRYGSEAINRYLDQYFRQLLATQGGEWYTGRRIMIERNDYPLGLNNGDIGVCEWFEGQWCVSFDAGRRVAVSMLPAYYALAFAISIHKSQGSEYAHVDIVLDEWGQRQTDNTRLLVNRELLYTAVTRAKQSFTIYSDRDVLTQALSEKNATPSPLAFLLQSKMN